MKIGRTSENDVVLHDHGVSRHHARIIMRGGQYFAEDVGSANGTALNGRSLTGEQLLRDGDRLGVGPVEFTFVWVPPDGDEDATRPIRRVPLPRSPLPSVSVDSSGQEFLATGELPAVVSVAPRPVPVVAGSQPSPGPASKGPRSALAQVPSALPVFEPLLEERTELGLSTVAGPFGAPSFPPVPDDMLEEREERTEVALPTLASPGVPPRLLPLMESLADEHTEVGVAAGGNPFAMASLGTVSPPPALERTDVLAPPGLPSVPVLPPDEPEERTELALPTLKGVAGLLEAATVVDVDDESTRPITRLPVATPLVPSAPPPQLARSQPQVAPVPPAPSASGPTAADRARERRDLARTRGGQLVLWWRDLSVARKLLTSLALLCVVAAVGGAVASVYLDGRAAMGTGGREPTTLGVDATPDSFGLGEGVRWERSDQKSFEFQFVAPTRAVALLRYQAKDISKEEVGLVLNGVNLGWVPPDTTTTAERELELILPVGTLKRGELNTVAFDNVRNPPGQETWRVWNLRVEIIPVPELPPEQLLSQAREYASAGRRFFDAKGVGSENLFRSWQQFRAAWLTLEALDTKPELYEDVRYYLSQASAELDHQCAQLMLEFQQSVQFRSARKARAALQEVSRRFPTTEHRCHNLAKEKAFEHEL
ncbi:FHA domain-containing protein [Myxococcus stipitatus DSM 14675]|uniref:FHA domain-containing protein n=1 Tax=Myxococcus stipitatus (strain DSM 14675 / JCM 12634 / Mx s8) TaxID=1278073 RepID=L7UBW5_MYXSD|nr:FHA domain-containing protein [Myxococcus stipitatus DSM 14675]